MRASALWDPALVVNGPGLGIQPDGFHLRVTGTTNSPVVIEAATDLSVPAWEPLETNTIPEGGLELLAPDWASLPFRYYRVRSP